MGIFVHKGQYLSVIRPFVLNLIYSDIMLVPKLQEFPLKY